MSLKKTLGTGTRMLASAAVAVVAIAMCGRADAAGFKSITDVPVSACANTAYLSDMDGRLWWNPAWKKRAAILVSNMAKVRSPKTTIDFVFDVGERIDPKSVRVTTSYEVEVPCVAERARDGASATAVNILFQTDRSPETSLVVQGLRLCSQSRGSGFNPWSGN